MNDPNRRKGGKRKHGRNKKKPSKMRYTTERRWLHNKLRRIRKNNSAADVAAFRERWLI